MCVTESPPLPGGPHDSFVPFAVPGPAPAALGAARAAQSGEFGGGQVKLVPLFLFSLVPRDADGGVPLLCENKANPQKMGSAITYARRYGLCAMLGIVGEEDDDGQRATPAQELPPAARPKSAPPKVDPPKVVADDIPMSPEDERNDWQSWVDEQIAGFEKHRTMAEHRRWSSTVKDYRAQCQPENKAEHDRLLAGYMKRKNQLENRS